MRIHIYVRVSTDAQAEKGYSLQTQIEACEKKALEMGATETVIHKDDGYSGETMDRPALADLRAAVRDKQVDGIVCYEPDRLSRKQLDQLLLTEEFEKAKVKLAFVTVHYEPTDDGRLMYQIRGAIAEFERQKIRERTMRGKRGKAQAGKIVMNTHPTGYDFDAERSMYVENQNADLVRRLFKMAAAGESISSIVRRLNRDGVSSPKGKFWHAATVARILHNPIYRGEAMQFREKREKVDDKWVTTERDPAEWIAVPCPALVSREEFDAVQKMVAVNKRFSPRNTRHTYLLQYIARCGICGRPMTIAMRGKNTFYYVCSSHRLASDTGEDNCGGRGIRADVLDDVVWEELKKLAVSASKVRGLIAQKKLLARSSKTLAALREQETELVKRQKTVMSFFNQGRIESSVAEESLSEIKKGLDDVRRRIADLDRVANIRSVEDRVFGFMAAVQNLDNRREACRQALEAVYVTRTDNDAGRYAKTTLDVRIVPK